MSLIGLNVVYGYDTDFSAQVAPSDSKTRFLDTTKFIDIRPNTNNDGTAGSTIIYDNGISPYGIEVRVTQSPAAINASDTF